MSRSLSTEKMGREEVLSLLRPKQPRKSTVAGGFKGFDD
jgi:hypothetical protein